MSDQIERPAGKCERCHRKYWDRFCPKCREMVELELTAQQEATGFDRYFEERMRDPGFALAFRNELDKIRRG